MKSLIERSAHKVGRDEHRAAGAIGFGLVLARRFIRPGLHDLGMAAFEKPFQLGEGIRRAGHFGSVGDDAISAEDVVGVLRARVGDFVLKDDGGGLFDSEFGALDEVRKISLEERERRSVVRYGEPCLRRRAVKLGAECLEHVGTRRIERQPPATRLRGRGLQAIALGIQKRADHSVERGEFLLRPIVGARPARFIAEPVELVLSGPAQQHLEVRLDLLSGERARNRAPAPAGGEIVEQRAGGRGQPQDSHERQVGRLGRRASSRAQRVAGQRHVALPFLGDEKDRTIFRRCAFQGGAVGYEGIGEISRHNRPEIAPYDGLGSAFQVPAI